LLETFYQCPAPPGLVNLLLPPGRVPAAGMPDKFKQTFRDWAKGRISFTAPD
jgi:hypothetical protein